MDSSPELLHDVAANLTLVQRDLAIINDCFLSARTVQHRLRGVGILSPSLAADLGVVGMAARASGLLIDARQATPWGAYQLLPLAPRVFEEGDCLARARLRIAEMEVSLDWLLRSLELYGARRQPRKPIAALAANSDELGRRIG